MKNLLRTTALLLIFNSSFLITKAQWVSIPDSNFGTWLNANGFSSCMQGNNTTGWQMDTTCNAVVTKTILHCSHAYLQDITGIEYFDNLNYLDCGHNLLDTLPNLPPSLVNLYCDNNQLTSILSLPASLTDISCTNNQLTSLPALPGSLANLYCDNNLLNNLPTLPTSLIQLYCSSNQLANLTALPASLTQLDCNYNQLISLPTLPTTLSYFSCFNNQLTSLPNLPDSLKTIDCSYNQLTNLPSLPDYVITFYCTNNQLTSLPALPALLLNLSCERNLITALPSLPSALFALSCGNNLLNALPALPANLNGLECGNNQLSSLPNLPASLNQLGCSANQLTTIPALPDSLGYLDCSANPNLTCLPELKKIDRLFFSNTGIICLQNYPQSNTFSDPALNTVLLCDPFNGAGCSVYWNISGKVYADSNANCLYDAGENMFSNLTVQLYQNGTLQRQECGNGYYSFDTDLGTYTYSIDTTNLPLSVTCPDSGYYTSVITALDSFDAQMNFGLRCKTGVFDLVAQSIDGRFRPGNTRQVNVSVGDASNFYGAHCAAGTNGKVQLIINGAAHYVSAANGALTPTSVINDTISWSIADFGAVNFFTDFNISVATDTAAVLGSQICFTLIVNPIAGDNNPTNNILTHCFTVVGSFDPNEKEVYPSGNIDTATHWLTYTIHFQNTGTAEAQHIYVIDTLDSNIDAGSFQLLAYSHQPMVQLKGNNLRFNFPNINLPDSNTNEAASHGYVQYKVKLKDNLPVGTDINNTAFIYFDFNAPVVTNTTSNTIALATGVANLGMRNADFGLNPNPATESVRISIDESMIGSIVTITDITGREVLHSAVQIRNPQFDIRNLSPGVYFVTLENKTGRLSRKLVKQ